MGTLLRYPYEVRSEKEYFEEIQDVKVTKDVLELAKHIVNQKAGHFEPDKFEDQYESALIDLINQKRAGKPITAKERPRGENVVDLMDALRKSIGGAEGAGQAFQKATQGRKRSEGDADADRRKETGEGGSGEEADSQGAAEVRLAPTMAPRKPQSAGRLLFRGGAAHLEVLLGHPGGPFWQASHPDSTRTLQRVHSRERMARHCGTRKLFSVRGTFLASSLSCCQLGVNFACFATGEKPVRPFWSPADWALSAGTPSCSCSPRDIRCAPPCAAGNATAESLLKFGLVKSNAPN
jgi:hypothetical protein